MVDFASYPVELLQQISRLLSDTYQRALGGTCRLFRSLVAPELFRNLTIDFHYIHRAQQQLQALANPQTTAHSLAGLFTKHLELRICNLEPLTQEVGEFWSFPEEAQRRKDIAELRGNFGPALIALKRCESLKVSTDPPGHGKRIPPWFADILSTAMTSISTIKEIEVSFQTGFPLPAIVAANTVLGLQRYAVTASGTPRSRAIFTPGSTANLLSSIDAAISGKPELRELKVDTGIYGYHGQAVPRVGQLFSGACMSSSPPLHLLSLDLDGWLVDKDGLSVALSHLQNLRTLNLGSGISGSADLIWDTLSEASIFLKSLRTKNATTPALLRYLSSYQGLEGVSLSPRLGSGLISQFQDSVMLRDVLNALSSHKASLKLMDIANNSWRYSVDDAAALLEFSVLESLAIIVTESVFPDLMDVVFSLPCLVVLSLSSAIIFSPWGRENIQGNHPRNMLLAKRIREFVIPTALSKSKIEEMRIKGGKRFRRRGDRFRFGTVELDGKWREIGEDEILDQRGWVVKRLPPPDFSSPHLIPYDSCDIEC